MRCILKALKIASKFLSLELSQCADCMPSHFLIFQQVDQNGDRGRFFQLAEKQNQHLPVSSECGIGNDPQIVLHILSGTNLKKRIRYKPSRCIRRSVRVIIHKKHGNRLLKSPVVQPSEQFVLFCGILCKRVILHNKRQYRFLMLRQERFCLIQHFKLKAQLVKFSFKCG